ncbi:MAG: T9SS type A sorting domain-containing protein [Bacteroidia bacterium]|nr:T9SS type A sorting domain-containing protein [Bacteroidia bacterium]
MKKNSANLFLILMMLMGFQKIHAQLIPSYSFSSAAVTYSAITGGTILGTNLNDDDVFDNVPIGFNFNYGGNNFNQLSVCANGFIKFGVLLNTSTYNPISDSFGDDTIVSALGADIASNAGGTLRYRTNGTAPNRIFIVQWRDYSSFANIDTVNFQIRLFETANRIEVHYGSFYVDVNNFYEVGLRGILANNEFNNRSVLNLTNTWATSSLGAASTDYCELDPGPPMFKPVNGQKYVWSPPPPCAGTPNAGSATGPTLACVGQTVNLSLFGSTSASGLTYQWQSSPNAVTWTSVGSATNMAFSPIYTTSIYYRCIVACGTNTAVSTSIQILPQTANVYATVPFLENFDNTWQNRCDLRNVPVSANWNSNPTTGDDSWRRQDDGVSANWSSSFGIVTPFAGIGSADFNSFDALFGNQGNLDLYVNMGTTSNYQLSFYHINSDGDDSLQILLSTNGGLTFVPKVTYVSADYSAIDANWNKKIISLGPVNSSSCVVRFLATSDFGISDIGMDSLQIKVVGCSAPVLTVAASQATLCNGTAVTLTASGATSYTWNTTANTSTISVTPSVTTVYTVTGSNAPGCTSTKTINLTVNQGPIISITGAPSLSLCPGGSAVITASGAVNYTWAAGSQTTAAISVTPAISTVYNVVGTNALGCNTNTSVTVFVVVCTNIQTQAASLNKVSIYPNPTAGEFTLELTNGLSKAIEVMDVTGRIVLTTTTANDKTDINLSTLANGVYYVRVASNNSVEVLKIIKE